MPFKKTLFSSTPADTDATVQKVLNRLFMEPHGERLMHINSIMSLMYNSQAKKQSRIEFYKMIPPTPAHSSAIIMPRP